MVLVSPDMIHQHIPQLSENHSRFNSVGNATTITPINTLENEMNAMLNNPSIPNHDKWLLYYQLMQRFLRHIEEERKPLITLSASTTPQSENLQDEQIINSIPISLRRKASMLLNWIKHTNAITWDKFGRVNISGTLIENSNIIDLIRDLLTERSAPAPTGLQEFCRALKKLNIPRTLIGNSKRWNTYTNSSHLTPENIYKTPTSTKFTSSENTSTPNTLKKQLITRRRISGRKTKLPSRWESFYITK